MATQKDGKAKHLRPWDGAFAVWVGKHEETEQPGPCICSSSRIKKNQSATHGGRGVERYQPCQSVTYA